MLAASNIAHNQITYSVSEISSAIKRTIEDNFGHVRVRGEISGWKIAASGHAYLKLKDENALIDAVCWKGVVGKIPFKPEDGLEITCSGRLTTYPGRSNYQLVIEYMEPAGVGALMALLEKRKHMLAAEGLFDEKRKKPLPAMPQVIGVVTSPTGAVIRDILHRLSDRFPCHVIVWPVLVQGEGAAEQIAKAINGFNKHNEALHGYAEERSDDLAGEISWSEIGGSVPPRIDLLIVARGGGSLEDLWAFNEEIVVRAAATSRIPLISAVGHETDTTLIDYASDRRAPTPTAAAEMAVPVRADLLVYISELASRMLTAITNAIRLREDRITGLVRGLPNLTSLIDVAIQRTDDWGERLTLALPASLIRKSQQLAVAYAKLQPGMLLQNINHHSVKLTENGERMGRVIVRNITDMQNRLNNISQLLETLNPSRVLERGFVLIKDRNGKLITRASEMVKSSAYDLQFFDGIKTVREAS